MKKKGNDTSDKAAEKKYVVSLEPRKVTVTSQDKKFLGEFLDIVEKNLTNPNLNIDFLCKKLWESRPTLNRKIKRLTGEPPKQFIQSYRLKRAKQLLEKNAGNVSEVAKMVGFSNEFSFSKSFKKKFGKSPKPYQDGHLKKTVDKTKGKQFEESSNRGHQKKMSIQVDFTLDELDREFIYRVVATKSEQMFSFKDTEGTPQRDEIFKQVEVLYEPPIPLSSNQALKHFTLREIMKKMRHKIEKMRKEVRDIYKPGVYSDKRLDFSAIKNIHVKKNALSAAAVCMKDDLRPGRSGYFELRVKVYGDTFNLCANEPFYHQPTAVGRMYTGVLLGEDVIVTAAHFANEKNVTGLRFIFGFAAQESNKPPEQIPDKNIYKGVEILQRVQNPGADWALVKLDRKVTDHEIAVLSQRDIRQDQSAYVVGYPCGLPLKYAPGVSVADISRSYFTADLDVYSGSSGSPIFCAKTHELIGIVSRAKPVDFRWTGSCWITMRYPKTEPNAQKTNCTKSLEFSKFILK